MVITYTKREVLKTEFPEFRNDAPRAGRPADRRIPGFTARDSTDSSLHDTVLGMGRSNGRQEQESGTLVNPDEGKLKPGGVLTGRALLLVLSKNFFGKTFLLEKNRNLLGRDRSCDIVLPDPLVSRNHCLISVDEQGCFHLEDLGARNSTFLNRKAVSRRAQLFYGDRLVLGSTILRFFIEEEVERK